MPETERVVDEMAPEPDIASESGTDETPDPDVDLALSLAEVARDLSGEESVHSALTRICEIAVDTVDGCKAAGVTVAGPDWFRTPAATEELVREVDRYQYETGEGPCVDALREHVVFRTGDLAADPRWPLFGEKAAALGVNSMLSFRLFNDEDTFGSLNLYAQERDAFSDRSVDVGAVFAAHAGLALGHAQDRDTARNLEQALDSNRRVGMAIGILMARHRLDEDAAFALLRGASQHANRKLRVVAEEVINTGEISR
jgi:GAF domain-containing protein